MKRQGYSAAEIADAINKGSIAVPEKPIMEEPAAGGVGVIGGQPDLEDDLDLSDEDR